MKENVIHGSNGSRLEIFESGLNNKFSFVYFDRNGKPYASKNSIEKSELDELITTFHKNESELLRNFKPSCASSITSNIIALLILIFFVCYSFVRSGYDLKLLCLTLPVSTIIVFAWFKRKRPTKHP